MATQSPFKFLDSYTIDDRDIFFGRDQEIEEVYKKVFQGQTLFIYGESGTGKSSLISCGLANRFKKSDWLPVNVRRGENINQSLLRELEKTSLTPVSDLNGSFSKNLFKYTRSLYLDYFKPVYFIFDQFEELYLLGSKEEWREFISGVKALTEHDLNVHFIFIIRSEYLHFLSEFEEELPEVFNNKIRVEKITRLKAKDCIEGPCKVFNIQYGENFADQLLDQLSPESIEVELTYLQVYLDRIYKLASASENGGDLEFSNDLLEDIGLVSDVLADFLDEQIESFSDQQSALAVLKGFVTVDGTKKQASLEDVVSFSKSLGHPIEEGVAQAVIHELLEKRILKELPDEVSFELRHDALAGKIFEKITIRERELIEVRQFLELGLAEFIKRKFLLNEKDLAYVEPHLPVLNLSGELENFVNESIKAAGKKRRNRKRVIGVISVIVILFITSVYGFFAARQQQQIALEQKEIAEQNASAADAQKQIAEQNALAAQESEQLAEANAVEAVRQAELAQQQQALADQLRGVAEVERQSAINERNNAEQSQREAERNALLAEEQRQLAENERTEAQRLRMLAIARSLGSQSIQTTDDDLKLLLAQQAYNFNEEFDGYPRQVEIYNSLYQASKVVNGTNYNLLQAHVGPIQSIIESEDMVLSIGSDGQLQRIEMGDSVAMTPYLKVDPVILSSDISPDQGYLGLGSDESKIILVDLNDASVDRVIPIPFPNAWHVQFAREGELLVTAGLQQLSILDLNTNDTTQIDIPAVITGIAPLNNDLLVLQADNKLVSLSLQDYSQTLLADSLNARSTYPTTIAISSDNNMAAIGFESGEVDLWSLDDVNRIQSIQAHTERVSRVNFNHASSMLVTASYEGTGKLWNLASMREQPLVFDDHDDWLLYGGFVERTGAVLLGRSDGAIRYYPLEMDEFTGGMCEYINRNLTEEEWIGLVGEGVTYESTCKTLDK